MDCGPTCLQMICKYYGRFYELEYLRKLCGINRDGVSLLGVSDAADKLGFRSLEGQVSLTDVKNADLPCLLKLRCLYLEPKSYRNRTPLTMI
ncbi:hypothetical protein BC343_25280 [Mucilaginibacter pedocola]|uniref:Peptidase C39 domain-containing protein n=2 Tax=Mucilaginibacter pedocola TaxID=1792845 RepID=A0A1S9PHB2_9SPHI|nr:hypothetical protein BC343_25280 [Mucilaginibacter pedocola]